MFFCKKNICNIWNFCIFAKKTEEWFSENEQTGCSLTLDALHKKETKINQKENSISIFLTRNVCVIKMKFYPPPTRMYH